MTALIFKKKILRRVLILPFLLIPFSSLEASIDKEIAEFCLKAKDFSGCIQEMSTKKNNAPTQKGIGNDVLDQSIPEDNLNKKLLKDKNDVKSLITRAKLRYLELGNTLGALSDLNDLIRINPDFSEAYYLRGIINAVEFEEFKEALLDINKAVEINKNNSQYYMALGFLKSLTLSKHEEALQDLNKAIKLDPKNSLAYFWRGHVNYEIGHDNFQETKHKIKRTYYEASIDDYSRSLKLYTDQINPLYSRLYPFGYRQNILANRGNLYLDLALHYENEYMEDENKQKALDYKKFSIDDFTSYLEYAPTIDEVENLKDPAKAFDITYIKIAGYYWRGSAYSWTKKSRRKNTCRDFRKVYRASKELDYKLYDKYHYDDSPLMEGFLYYGPNCR